jgi:hypothetical protein
MSSSGRSWVSASRTCWAEPPFTVGAALPRTARALFGEPAKRESGFSRSKKRTQLLVLGQLGIMQSEDAISEFAQRLGCLLKDLGGHPLLELSQLVAVRRVFPC